MVHPLRIIHHPEHRFLGGKLGEQAQHSERNEETVGRFTAAKPEGRLQSRSLRARKVHHAIQHPAAQRLQSSVAELRLGLDPGDPRDLEPRRRVGRVVEQPGLADPRLSPDDQHGAEALTSASKQPVQGTPVVVPPHQLHHAGTVAPPHRCGLGSRLGSTPMRAGLISATIVRLGDEL